MRFITETRVTATQTDSGEGMSVLGAAGVIQDNVCAFFATVGKDNVALRRDYGAAWMFVKNRFVKYAVAHWNDEITVESFISSRTAATIIVDTAIKLKGGDMVYYARTEMCVIDLTIGRIKRISSVDLPEEMGVYASEKDVEFTRMDFAGLKELYSFTVPSTSIDYCNHLNNVEYLRFILNTATAEYGRVHIPIDVEIRYVSQSKEGDEVKIFGTQDGECYEVVNGGNISAKCRIIRT